MRTWLHGSALRPGTLHAETQHRFWLRRAKSLILATLALTPCMALASAGKPQHLTCDSLDHPLGIDSPQPRFSWQLQDAGFAARQTAYRIEVATKPALLAHDRPDIWDSSRVPSNASIGIAYGGPG